MILQLLQIFIWWCYIMLKMLVHFLYLDENETHTLYDMATESRSSNDIVTSQNCANYMLGNSYVIESLRPSMETGAGVSG